MLLSKEVTDLKAGLRRGVDLQALWMAGLGSEWEVMLMWIAGTPNGKLIHFFEKIVNVFYCCFFSVLLCHVLFWLQVWNNEIKRHLLLGRKVMTNLDSIFKSRDITLPTKVRLVKAMVSPVVMYGCGVGLWRKLSTEELKVLNCGVGEDSWESLGLQGDSTSPFWRRSVLGIHWKDWC